MRKLLVLAALALVTGLLALGGGQAVASPSPVQTWNFNNLPFVWDQDYVGRGPALTFGEDVHVHYEALNNDQVRLTADDTLSWVLTQRGTAVITALDDEAVLYEGAFTVTERGTDVGNDSSCQDTSSGAAWLGTCEGLFSTVEFIDYTWMITGGTIYYYNFSIAGAGNYFFTIGKGERQDTDQSGPGC